MIPTSPMFGGGTRRLGVSLVSTSVFVPPLVAPYTTTLTPLAQDGDFLVVLGCQFDGTPKAFLNNVEMQKVVQDVAGLRLLAAYCPVGPTQVGKQIRVEGIYAQGEIDVIVLRPDVPASIVQLHSIGSVAVSSTDIGEVTVEDVDPESSLDNGYLAVGGYQRPAEGAVPKVFVPAGFTSVAADLGSRAQGYRYTAGLRGPGLLSGDVTFGFELPTPDHAAAQVFALR